MNDVRIVTDNGQVFDYYNIDDLNIRLNRVVDDYNDIETRFSEFSYQFSLPKTKNNNTIFQHADVGDVINKFERNNFNVIVFLNSTVLFKGILSLLAVDENNYRCVLLSKVSELIDDLGELELREITTLEDIDWDYENTIRTHVNANFQSCDETPYQFPLVYYSTFFAPPDVLESQVDFMGYNFNPDRMVQNYYYILNKTDVDNQVYYHQMPLAFYLVPVMEAVLAEVGWSISGSFFEQEDVKRIIIPYVGDNDIYDESVYCTDNGVVSTGGTCDVGTLKLRTANFLPDMTCTDFINAVINTFNLYFSIDLNNKVIAFETYNTLFTNRNNPYDLNGKIDAASINFERIDNPDPSLKFDKADSNAFFGDNTYYTTGSTNARFQQYRKHNEVIDIYNYYGTSDEQVDVGFGEPVMARKFLRNKANYNNNLTNGVDSIVFLPQLTKQTLKDNTNNPFYKRDTDTVVNNTEETIKHDGLPTLLYYYGQSSSTFIQQLSHGISSDWFYINFHGTKMRIPFASAYAYTASRNRINQVLNQELDINKRAYASAMQSIYLMMGSGYTHNHNYSLVLSEQGDVYPTLYNEFHEEKYRRYRESYVLVATVRLNIEDWNSLKMHVPIIYNKQIYSLLAIEDFDCLNSVGRIKMIRV